MLPPGQKTPPWSDAWYVDRINGEAERCPRCGRFVSVKRWETPRKIRLTNTHLPDRLTNWLTEPLVVSCNFHDCFLTSGLPGIRAFLPVEAVKIGRQLLLKTAEIMYYCAEVDYTENVKIDYARSRIYGQKYDWSCELCNPEGMTCDRIERLAVNVFGKTADIFKVYSLGLVANERFYEFVQDHHFTNFNLVPIESFPR